MTSKIILNRRSIRNYDTSYKIPREELLNLINTAQRSPSAGNLQPWRFIIVDTPEGKESIRKVMIGNYSQVDTSSAIIFVLVDLEKHKLAKNIFETAVEKGLMPEDVKERQIANITSRYENTSKELIQIESMFDAGLVAQNIMLLAKEKGLDTGPMHGFDANKIYDVLKVDSNRYQIAVLIAIGKANEEGFPSVRLDVKDTVSFL
ncbi:MAG: nitroreductase family protein [Acholeplasmataceae bacterium]|nr:nitroreductase family protein [Acholeplasmataceae bacterium]